MTGEVLAAETAWWAQAHLKLRIAQGSGDSNLSPPHVIVSLQDCYQCYLGEIQRETISKTVRGSGRWWPALTERDCDFGGGGVHGQYTPQGSGLQHEGHTEILLKEELRRDSRLGRGPVLMRMCKCV